MARATKHGGHRILLTIPAAAAGSAADTVADMWTYDAFVGSTVVNSPSPQYDTYTEEFSAAVLAAFTTLTGQATHYVSPRLTHVDSTGTTKNQLRVDFSATGVVLTALTSAKLEVASGATVPGAGTGTLTVVTGTALPWTLVAGDMIIFDRLSNDGTGLATPALSVTAVVKGKGA